MLQLNDRRCYIRDLPCDVCVTNRIAPATTAMTVRVSMLSRPDEHSTKKRKVALDDVLQGLTQRVQRRAALAPRLGIATKTMVAGTSAACVPKHSFFTHRQPTTVQHPVAHASIVVLKSAIDDLPGLRHERRHVSRATFAGDIERHHRAATRSGLCPRHALGVLVERRDELR